MSNHRLDQQLVNEAKRHLPTTTAAKVPTLADFTTLPDQADSSVGHQALDVAGRAQLQGILVSSGQTASEGDLVRVDGFLVGKPHSLHGRIRQLQSRKRR